MEILFLIVFLVIGFIAAYASSSNKGAEGERLIHKKLTRFEKEGPGKLLSNIYLPKINGGTTEIDLILIHPKGLFVFESKNYSGWIFGNEAYQNWTQTLPKGRRGGVHKERFYNPILQNASHIKHLMYRIEKSPPVWSMIVFSDYCELKDITVRSKNVRVVQCRHVAATIEQICDDAQPDFFNETEITDLYNYLRTFTNVSDEEKDIHTQKAFQIQARSRSRGSE